jgi:hypothetical protein
VVVDFYSYASFDHGQNNFTSEILLGIVRWDREIALLIPRFVTQIRSFLPSRVPLSLHGIDKIEPTIFCLIEPDIIKDEEFHLRSPIALVCNP